jgi:hypothetical protein
MMGLVLMHVMGPWDEMPPLEDWAETQTLTARRFVTENGEAAPVFLFLAPHPEDPSLVVQGTTSLSAFLCGSTRDELLANKERMNEVLNTIVEVSGAFAILMIHEGWMRKIPREKGMEEALREVAEAGGVVNCSDRIEVLRTLFETKTSHLDRTWEILRDAEGKPSIGEELPQPTSVDGRFASFLHGRSGTMN